MRVVLCYAVLSAQKTLSGVLHMPPMMCCKQFVMLVGTLRVSIFVVRLEASPTLQSDGFPGQHDNHHDFGEELEWRPPLFYANPLGHRVPATLKIFQRCMKHERRTSARCARGAFVSLLVDVDAQCLTSLETAAGQELAISQARYRGWLASLPISRDVHEMCH